MSKNHDYTGAPGQKKTIAVKCEECPYGYNRLFRPMNGKLNFSNVIDAIVDIQCSKCIAHHLRIIFCFYQNTESVLEVDDM